MTRRRVPSRVALARAEALFVSTLQRSDVLTQAVVREAVRAALRVHGTAGCLSRMAQEFGEHPEVAAQRMSWVLAVVRTAYPPVKRSRRRLAPARSPAAA